MSTHNPTKPSVVTSNDEHLLLRSLHGELSADAEHRLAERLEHEPALRAHAERLRAAWDGLELPPPAAPPIGLSTRLVALARQEKSNELSWALAPDWVRAGTAAALVVGVLAGAGIGRLAIPRYLPTSTGSMASLEVASDEPLDSDLDFELFAEAPQSLAESYWTSLDSEIFERAEDGP